MEMQVFVLSQEPERVFKTTENGQEKEVKAVDLTLSDGLNNFLVSAYEKNAQRLIDHKLERGAWIRADVTFIVKTLEAKDGKPARAFQTCKLNNYVAM